MVMQVYQRLESGQRSITLATLDRLAMGFEIDPAALIAAGRTVEELARDGEAPGSSDRADKQAPAPKDS